MMRQIFWLLLLGGLVVRTEIAFAAPTAVLEVNEEQWYTDNRDGALGGARLTRWYAPLPVFFEGWKSSPRANITEYKWDFGDGSPIFYGFNAAHVYETPGTYTCSLTVTDSTGAANTTTIPITVLARTGKPTYYVDARGNDANAGTSPGTGAWKTADRAFLGLTNGAYTPGTQILFNRGDTFDVTAGNVEVGHWKTGSGWVFGAYGTGAKPLIKLKSTGGNFNSIFYINGVGPAHVTFQDLVFDCSTTSGARSDFLQMPQEVDDILFLRVDIKNMNQGFIFNGGKTDRRQSGIFIVDSTMYSSNIIENFITAARVALLGNTFDYSGNHINYLAYVDKGVIAGNTFSRPAFGRAALRIDGAAAATPTNNVEVCDNNFLGWIDPIDGFPTAGWDDPASVHYDPQQSHNGGGKRYNFHLLYFAPNTPEEQVMQDVTFERNTATNAERFFYIGDYENLMIRDNTFSTPDANLDPYRFNFGFHYDYRPLKDIFFLNNTVISNEDRKTVDASNVVTNGFGGMFGVFNYTGPAYPLRSLHMNINIKGNTLVLQGRKANVAGAQNSPYIYFDTDDAAQRAQIFADNNRIYTNNEESMEQVGGTWLTGGVFSSLTNWKASSGQDASTTVKLFSQTPNAGTAVVAANTSVKPISVNYSGAQAASGWTLKNVSLWYKKGTTSWKKTTLSATTSAGTFAFVDVSGNDTYYFALQAEDTAGHISPPPAGLGQVSTVYVATIQKGANDTTPPIPGTPNVAAVTKTNPIVVTYSGASDSESGLSAVHLWAKKENGAWTDTGLTSTTAAGTFPFSGMSGDGVYYFQLLAIDVAGNTSAAASGNGQSSTLYDTTSPSVGNVTTAAAH